MDTDPIERFNIENNNYYNHATIDVGLIHYKVINVKHIQS